MKTKNGYNNSVNYYKISVTGLFANVNSLTAGPNESDNNDNREALCIRGASLFSNIKNYLLLLTRSGNFPVMGHHAAYVISA